MDEQGVPIGATGAICTTLVTRINSVEEEVKENNDSIGMNWLMGKRGCFAVF